jgi:hypothetical protein
MRIPRVTPVLRSSHALGRTQQLRAESWWYNLRRELEIKLDVFRHGTLPIMKPGAAYDFVREVQRRVEPQVSATGLPLDCHCCAASADET